MARKPVAGNMSSWHNIALIGCMVFSTAATKAQVGATGDVVVHTPPGLSLLFEKKQAEKKIVAKKELMGKVTAEATMKGPAETKGAEETKAVLVAKVPPGAKAPIPEDAAPRTNPTEVIKKNDVPETVAPPVPVRWKPAVIRHEKVIYSGKGYRVQLYYGPDRGKAEQLKREFSDAYPEIKSYLIYYRPYFRVKVGNFKTRNEALGLLKKANAINHPSMIVPDAITITTF